MFGNRLNSDFCVRTLFLLLGLLLFLQAESAAALRDERPDINGASKHRVIREVTRKWIKIGDRQYQRGFFSSAERSLLEALGYREYLTVYERTRLDDLLEKTRNALTKRKLILEHIRQANGLVTEGLLAEARSALLKAKSSEYLTGKEHELIVESLKKIDVQLKSERSAEDLGSSMPVTEPDMLFVPKTNEAPIIKPAEPDQREQEEEGHLNSISRKQKLERSYGRAIVRDAVNKVRDCLSDEKFYKAKGAIATAKQAINENRMHLSDKLFEKYTAELKELSDRIEGGRKKWLGDVNKGK